ncbi:MAG TPA: restriction endonuclease subunit S [Candidatus Erysipelatoclostridium merdavium]|mgnify:CR=1 FL=1|uniref:Restriction endonuclease subunit S n=1 Tax=Candidatus Erysipelatoclostridium merdavium TaxID=2838566 RepID=A0A9D1XLW4_9FIRM|nr:restriction endonuclease subunit S [Candidatus Erysipelatoclostridium merdavium]
MSKWTECTIGDLCETISETYKGKDEKVVLINTSDVLEGKVLNHKSVQNKNLKGQFKKTFRRNDILYSEIRPANKRFAFIDFEATSNYIASTKLMVLRHNDKVLPEYLFAILKSNYMLAELQHLAETRSGTFPQITFSSELAPIKVRLPDKTTQKQIVSILSSIEQKISVNCDINNNLEQQAKAIYQQMFVENANLEWSEGTLSDIADITMGQSPSGSSYNEDGTGTIFFQGRAEFGFRFPTVRLFTTEPKRMACANDTLMSVRAPVGDFNVAHTDCCIGRGLAAIHSKNNHQSFVLYTMFSLKKQLGVFNGEGTVFGSINRKALNDMPILIPNIERIKEFENIVAPMDSIIRNNYDEICRLQEIRDSLLPRLMSGEIDASDIDI